MSPGDLLAAAEAVERAYRLERGLDFEPWRALAELATKHRPAQHSPAPDTEAPSWRL